MCSACDGKPAPARKIATEGPIISEHVTTGKVKVVSGRHDLEDGRVEFFA
jgi:carbonic anhydrase